MKLHSSYDLSLKGHVDVAPFKALSDDIVNIEGRSSIDIDIKGGWLDASFEPVPVAVSLR